jgi:hypothetical protein
MAAQVFSIIAFFFLLCGALNLFFYMMAVYPQYLLAVMIFVTLFAGYYDYTLLKNKNKTTSFK